MKKAILIIALITTTSFAATVEFIGPCSSEPFYKASVDTNDYNHLGELTIKLLEQANIPFIGTVEGMKSINDSPHGLDSMEVLSDTKLRAYGWCNTVNRVVVGTMPHETLIQNDDNITWYYCYAVYDKGEWLKFYEPSYELKSEFICKKD